MTRGQRIGLGVAAALFLVGLIAGFWPQTIDSPGRATTNVDCGSPFAPDSSPTGTSSAQTWADVLGYENNGVLDDSPDMLARYCEIYLDDNRVLASVLTGAGLLGLGIMAFDVRSRSKAARARQEAEWRAQGWVPASEVPTPPPGWVPAPDQSGAPRP